MEIITRASRLRIYKHESEQSVSDHGASYRIGGLGLFSLKLLLLLAPLELGPLCLCNCVLLGTLNSPSLLQL